MRTRDRLASRYNLMKRANDFEGEGDSFSDAPDAGSVLWHQDYDARVAQAKREQEEASLRLVADAMAKGGFVGHLRNWNDLKSKSAEDMKAAKASQKIGPYIDNLPLIPRLKTRAGMKLDEVLAYLKGLDDKSIGLAYGGSAAIGGLGGGALGALVAGKGNRLKGTAIGAILGALAMASANYGRRKYQYGKDIKF